MADSAQPVPVVPGDVLAGKYQVEQVLGRGGMGIVVAVRHRDLGELFAIKLLLPQAAADPAAVDRFLREARAAVRLKGEHVAKVTDVGRLDDGSPYIVMEHLSGTDLRKHVRAVGPLPLEEAAYYVLQACEAIAEAHALGIIHRDLKPANLFLTRRPNGTPSVKVLDFGISKHTTQEAVEITKTGEILGTPLYMAPEQMARMKSADARCDVWSMGIVLYELLTGTTPFHSTMITEVVARVLQEDPAPPSHHRPGLPPALDAFVIKCLQKRPAERFQTIQEFAEALRAVVGQAAPFASIPGSVSDSGRSSVSAISAPSVPATLNLTASALPTSRLSSTPVSGVPQAVQHSPVASTVSGWGSTGQLRAAKNRTLIWALAVGGVAAAGLVAVGIWSAVGSSEGSAPAASSPPIIALPSGATVTVTVSTAPATTEAPSASAAVSASASPSAAPSAKPVVSASAKAIPKRPPVVPPASTPPNQFGGIR